MRSPARPWPRSRARSERPAHSSPIRPKPTCATRRTNSARSTSRSRSIPGSKSFATEVGDRDTAQLARAIRREDERMAKYLQAELGRLVKDVIRAEIPRDQRPTASRSRSRRAATTGRSRAAASEQPVRTTSRSAAPRASGSRSTASRASGSRSASTRASGPRSASPRSASSRSSSSQHLVPRIDPHHAQPRGVLGADRVMPAADRTLHLAPGAGSRAGAGRRAGVVLRAVRDQRRAARALHRPRGADRRPRTGHVLPSGARPGNRASPSERRRRARRGSPDRRRG